MAVIPTTYRAIRRTPGTGTGTNETPLKLEITTETTLPNNNGQLGSHDVLIKIHAVSLNYRDVLMLHGMYPGGVRERGIAASDCSAEVVAVGEGVTQFSVGDKVAPAYDLGNLTGEIEATGHLGLGGDEEGVLREYAVYEERAQLFPALGSLRGNAVGAPGSLGKNKSVFIQGTGGVSMFALLIALAGGLKPIITSSSDAKLEALRKKLGEPDLLGYSYRTNPDQAAEVQRLTDGKGVDIVVNTNGPAGIPADLDSLVPSYGTISEVGFLAGTSADWNPGKLLTLIMKTARLQGVTVGSKVEFEALNKFLEEKKVRLDPLIDENIFDFEHSQEAFDYLWSGKHVGKVVIRL